MPPSRTKEVPPSGGGGCPNNSPLGSGGTISRYANAKPSASGFVLERRNDEATQMPEPARAEQSVVHEDDDGVVLFRAPVIARSAATRRSSLCNTGFAVLSLIIGEWIASLRSQRRGFRYRLYSRTVYNVRKESMAQKVRYFVMQNG